MLKLTAAVLALPLCVLLGYNVTDTAPQAQAEPTELAQLNILNDIDNMDMVHARAMRNHAVSMQTYAFVAAR